MTSPGMGMPGFGYTDTSVAAKLSLDIPSDSVDILKNVAMYSNDLQSSMEASARFGQEFMEYLQMFPQIQRQVLDLQKETLQVLRDSSQAIEQLRNSSAGYSGVGYGMAAGAGAMMMSDRYATRSVPAIVEQEAAMASSGSSPENSNVRDSQLNSYIQHTGSTFNPVGYMPLNPADPNNPHSPLRHYNMFGGKTSEYQAKEAMEIASARQKEVGRQEDVRGRRLDVITGGKFGHGQKLKDLDGHSILPEEEEEKEPSSDRERSEKNKPSKPRHSSNWHNVLGNVLGNFNVGAQVLGADGTPLAGRAAMTSRILGAASSGISALPMAAKALGGVGLGVGAAGLAFNAVQNVGEQLEGYKNMDVHGHTLSGGMGVQRDVMLMSMNPLLSTEQSREIIMGALNSGRTGDSYTSAVDFIKKNLLDMNMEVGKSVEILKTNVDEGRQSLASVKGDLFDISGLAKNGSKTQEEASSQYSEISKFLVGQGGSVKGGAGGQAVGLTSLFNNKEEDGTPNPLAESTSSIVTGALSSQQVLNQLLPSAPGSDYYTVLSKLSNSNDKMATAKALQGIFEKYAKTAKNTSQDKEKQQAQFYLAMTQGLGIQIDRGTAANLYDQTIEGIDDPNKSMTAQGQGFIDQTNTNYVTTQDGKQVDVSSLQTFDQWLATNPGKSRKDYNSAMGFNSEIGSGSLDGNEFTGEKGDTGGVDAESVKKLITSGRNLVAIDPKGVTHYLDAGDRDQVIGLSNGTWRLQNANFATNGSRSKIKRNSNDAIVSGSNVVDLSSVKKIISDQENTYGPKVNLSDLSGNDTNQISNDMKDKGDASYTSTNNSDGTTTIAAAQGTQQGNNSNSMTIQIVPGPGLNNWFNVTGVNPGNVPTSQGSTQSSSGYGGVTPNSMAPGTQPTQGRPK